MAYCNKDLNAMLREYLGDPSVHIYTNEEYARFSKVLRAYAYALLISDDTLNSKL